MLSALTPGLVPEGSAPAGAPVTVLREGDYIFFKNPEAVRYVSVAVEGDLTASKDCSTYIGFECRGASCESRAIEPGGFVSLCFHDRGRYGVSVKGTEPALRGVIEVRPR